MSDIDTKYSQLGGPSGFLGKPTAAETSCPDGTGRYRHFEHGSIYWHPLTGAHEVHGLIRGKWATLGWEKSSLGYPKTDESSCPVASGRYNQFQGGTILWVPPSNEAFEVHGAIRSKFGEFGWESGLLGFPTTDETPTPDGMGRFNHFQHGSIYWKPSIGAHEVHGLIRQYWADHGWEKNPELGYPISDELPTAGGSQNRYSDFENGILFWKAGSKAATALQKCVLGNASKSAGEVVAEIVKVLKPMMQVDSRIYFKSGPSLASMTDYSFDGATVHNRRYKIRTVLGVNIDVLPDPWIKLDLSIEIAYPKPGKTIVASLSEWSYHVHVPAGTSVVVSASEIGDKIKKAVGPQVGKVNAIGTVPDGINVLSVKVMPNGDLNAYIEPLLG